jgi:hypothetical protein
VANFIPINYTITTSVSPPGALNAGCRVTGGGATKHYNDLINLTATETSGWKFDAWEGDYPGFFNELDFNMPAKNVTVIAKFRTDEPVGKFYILSYSASEGGRVIGDTYQRVYQFSSGGTPVTAVPNPGYRFVEWTVGVRDQTRTDTNVTKNIHALAFFTNRPESDYSLGEKIFIWFAKLHRRIFNGDWIID